MLIFDDPLSGISDLLEYFLFEGVVAKEASEVIDLSTINDDDRVPRFVLFVNRHFGNFPDDFHAVNDLTEDDIFPIQMWTGFESKIELRGISISSTVGHRQ